MKKQTTRTTIICVTKQRAHALGCELGKRGAAWRRRGRVLQVSASAKQILAASKRVGCKVVHKRTR